MLVTIYLSFISIFYFKFQKFDLKEIKDLRPMIAKVITGRTIADLGFFKATMGRKN